MMKSASSSCWCPVTRSAAVLATILLILIAKPLTTSAAGLNGTVCILAPPEMAARLQQEVQRQVMEQLQLQRELQQEQQLLLNQQGGSPLLTPGIPPAFRSSDPRYNVPLRPSTGSRSFFDRPPPLPSTNNSSAPNFWDKSVNGSSTSSSTPSTTQESDSRSGNRSPANSPAGYQQDDPTVSQQRIPVEYNPLPVSPNVYDRSGFRREPLHPSFNNNNNQSPDQKVPSLVPNDGTLRTGPGNQNRNPDNVATTTPATWSRYTTPAPRKETPPQTSFFDPTRRPKTNRDQVAATTRKPFYNRNPSSGGSGGKSTGRDPGSQGPQLTKEVTTRRPSKAGAGGTANADDGYGNNADPTQAVDLVPGPVEPKDPSVPEYAYIKQPISAVLDQPDLELEGKPVKFGILKDALDRVGLLDLMSQENPVTIFAPTDEAFLNLDADTLTRMQQNPTFLRNTMLRHIVNFDMPPDSLRNNIVVPAYSGEPLIMNVVAVSQKQIMMVGGVPIIAATNTLNGVIYVINKVMTEETTSATVVEELAKRPEVSVFYQFIARSTQIRRLQGQGPFTILAPNNSAFDRLPRATRQALDFNPILLEKLLSFHVVEGAVFQKEMESVSSIPSSSSTPTAGGAGNRVEPIKLRATPDGSILVNEVAFVRKADIATGNGVVHIIDQVLMPAELASTFRKIEARSLAKQAAAAARNTAAGGGGTTAASSTSSSSLQRDQPPSVRPSFGFSSPRARSANFAVRTGPGRDNGLNPEPRDGSGIEREGAPKTPDGEPAARFFRWVQKSGFLDVLTNAGRDYTVILPIDRAVNRLPIKYQQALETNARQLESLLMYHIVPGAVNLSKLRDEDTIPTVSGKDVRFNRLANQTDGNSSRSGDASASTTTPSSATPRPPTRDPNGRVKNETAAEPVPSVTFSGAGLVGQSGSPSGKIVYLLVDRVMYPPQGNLLDVIKNSPILKSLASLIKVAGLEAGLSDTGPFTLFAPSDEAFQKLPIESIEYLSHDAQSSRAFLLRHIIRPVLFTSAVPIGNSTVIESTTGERLQLVREKDVVKVDGVGIRYADITATNGVIHVIDHVL